MKKNHGFTLIEILLVVVIIGILVAMTVPNIANRGDQARVASTHTDIEANVATALDLYKLDNGRYPTTEQGLAALMSKPSSDPVPISWNGPYLKKRKIPHDAWGREYVYTCPGKQNTETYDLASLGPDGKESSDDIVNWTP